MGNLILEIGFFIVSPKFGFKFLLILKHGFLLDLMSKSFDFHFVGTLFHQLFADI